MADPHARIAQLEAALRRIATLAKPSEYDDEEQVLLTEFQLRSTVEDTITEARTALASAPAPDTTADRRPTNCRFRLHDEGKAYPRSSCAACGKTVTTGLGNHCTKPDTTAGAVQEAAKVPEVAALIEAAKITRAAILRLQNTWDGGDEGWPRVSAFACTYAEDDDAPLTAALRALAGGNP